MLIFSLFFVAGLTAMFSVDLFSNGNENSEDDNEMSPVDPEDAEHGEGDLLTDILEEDAEDESAPENEEDEPDPRGWEDDSLLVSVDGAPAEYVAFDEFEGTDADETVVTNLADDVGQHIELGDGDDVAEIAIGDSVDVNSDLGYYSDDPEANEEGGDRVLIRLDDRGLENAPSSFTTNVNDLTALDSSEFGEDDFLHIEADPDVEGELYVRFSRTEDAFRGGPSGFGIGYDDYHATVFFVPDGVELPENLNNLHDYPEYLYSYGMSDEEIEGELSGIKAVAKIYLGFSHSSYHDSFNDLSNGEPPHPAERHVSDGPQLTSNLTINFIEPSSRYDLPA
ncbi:hypothetical protein [Planktotalea sp.]|uniref:hypothetical protein n=1 Tax=Planktotalea sp. TaxID=2029877 RepID=UPI003298A67F